MKTKVRQIMSAAVCAAVFGAYGVDTSAIIRQDPGASLLWKTVTAPDAEVMLDWPSGATHAVLSVDGIARVTVNDATLASTNISFTLPSTPAEEKTVTLSVSYLDGSDAVVGSDEAKLGLVCGVDGASTIQIRDAAGRAWHKAGASSAVLPVPEETASLSIDGATVLSSPVCPDWYWWHPIPGRTVALSLSLECGSSYENTVSGTTGMVIIYR